jgi:hypothetical protein
MQKKNLRLTLGFYPLPIIYIDSVPDPNLPINPGSGFVFVQPSSTSKIHIRELLVRIREEETTSNVTPTDKNALLQDTYTYTGGGGGGWGMNTLVGTVWGLPILLPQKPRLTGTMESLARMMAPLMAVATSLLHFTPRPTWPL